MELTAEPVWELCLRSADFFYYLKWVSEGIKKKGGRKPKRRHNESHHSGQKSSEPFIREYFTFKLAIDFVSFFTRTFSCGLIF